MGNKQSSKHEDVYKGAVLSGPYKKYNNDNKSVEQQPGVIVKDNRVEIKD